MIPPLSEALAERGYETLTAVQQAVISPDLEGADLLVSAQTGSGKTVGFGLAIAPTLLGDDAEFGPAGTPLALIVAPTRELAMQVMHELRWLYAKTGAWICSCVGGMDMRQERRALERGAHIVVGTPGRLSDHLRRGSLDLGAARAVVLDEADEMLDLGFREDLEFILGEAPEERRTLLFSATVSPVIAKLAKDFQKDAQRVNTIDKSLQHSDISYQALRVAQSDSDQAIFNLLRYHDDESAIVFANTRAQVNHLTARLGNRGLAVVSISGELSQQERSHALQAMRDGRARVCVATDVAARGIDLPNLNLVIHADLPKNTEGLLHRSGRTGRAGRKGVSALIVGPRDIKKAERLLKFAKISAEWTVPPSADEIVARDEEKLLNDASWGEPVSEEQAAFAARLLERHGADAVAAAMVRMHQSRQGAPEELLAPDAPQKRERKEFGPSRWFSLSVGRAARAEPRWLLPMILRATDLDKADIGAIRIQQDESYVEIAQGKADQVLSALGADGTLSDDVVMRAYDGVPEAAQRGGKPSGPRKPHRGGDGGDRGAPRTGGKPRGDKPRYDKPRDDKPRGAKPVWKDKDGDAPRAKPKPEPRGENGAWVAKGASAKGDKPKSAKPAGAGKPKSDFKPAMGGKPKPAGGGKPKTGGKPATGAASAGKPAGKPFKRGASDPSKPLKGRPGATRKPRAGGFEAPRRPKK